jgi:thioredoxin-related protein
MQALFEALNSGDKELAWQYSVALAKRDAEIQRTVSKVTDYRLLASEALGERPATEINPETDEVGATRMELKELIERTRLEQAKKKISDDSLIGTTTMPHATGDEWAQQGQPAAAQVASSKIPVDPAGKVKVLIFSNEKGLRVNEFAKSLKPLQEKFKNDPKVSMVGLTMRTYALPGLKKLGAMTSFPFPLVNGEALAPELRIQRYPTFVFLAETSKETYHLEGERGVEEVERVLNVMKGSSK